MRNFARVAMRLSAVSAAAYCCTPKLLTKSMAEPMYKDVADTISYFEYKINSSSADEYSVISQTDAILREKQKNTSLSHVIVWLLHYKNVNQDENMQNLSKFWYYIRERLLSNKTKQHQIYRFTLASFAGYFQFIVEKCDNQWIVYKSEPEWLQINENINQLPKSSMFSIIDSYNNWKPELYNHIKNKYGEKIKLNKDEITEFIDIFEKYVNMSVAKELLIDTLVENKIFDKYLCGKVFQPILQKLIWDNMDNYDKFDMIPMVDAQKYFEGKYDFNDNKTFQNFVFSYKETESGFGFAKIFGHVLNSEIEMLKVELFE